MDALRLLSCSTSLKIKNARDEKERSIPSWPKSGKNSNEGFPQKGQKRKRGIDEGPDRGFAGLVLQNGEKSALKGPPESGPASGSGDEPTIELLEEERRSILKRHKIKVTDLRAIRKSQSKTSKKAQKEAARIFPRPLTSFDELRTRYGVNRALAENVAEQGYLEPTEVQLASIPLLLGGESEGLDGEPDLLTIAPTGSGKTLAFLIPLVHKICLAHRDRGIGADERHISAIIVAPTKELVGQIVNEGRKLTARTGVSISEMRKGMRVHDDRETILDSDGVNDEDSASNGGEHPDQTTATLVKSDILVTTPLLFVNAITESSASTHTLPKISNLVLDEADVLLDPIFRTQTLAIWSACTSRDLRISLWSATIGSNIESLAFDTIASRQRDLDIITKQGPPLLRVVVGLKDSALPPTITHKLTYAATEPGKLLGLRQLIRPPPSLSQNKAKPKPGSASGDTHPTLRPPFLVFTQTIERATALYKELLYDLPTLADGQSRIAVLHSNLSSSARADTMARFRKGSIWILITTDLLSRGVDFRGVNVVVNYDIPNTAASYVHRAGRTGRAGREGGVCVTLYTKEDVRYVKNIANVIAASQKGRSSTSYNTDSNNNVNPNIASDIPEWLLQSLPQVSRKDRVDLKQHGVDVRRGVREGEEKEIRKKKMKARIGTVSGYDRRKEERRRGAIEGSKRRKAKEMAEKWTGGGEEWGGISD
jgi:ATP-dependent RNA helicase DDX52/ROK1